MGAASTPPTVSLTESPVYRVCINAEWWAHISGVITQLTYRDAWAGTDTEIDDAIQTIRTLLNVGEPIDSDCEDLP